MSTSLTETLSYHTKSVLKGTHLLYGSMLIGVALNQLDFISDDRFNPFFNGLIIIILLFGIMYSISALTFDVLVRKTLLQYHSVSMLSKGVMLLLFVLLNMLSDPPFAYLFIVVFFYIGSFIFDYIAFKTAQTFKNDTLEAIIAVPANRLEGSLLQTYKKSIMYSYRIFTIFTAYILTLIIFRYQAIYQGLALGILIVVIIYHHLDYRRFSPLPVLHVYAHGIFQMTLLVIQFSLYHAFVIHSVFLNSLLLVVSMHILLIFTVLVRTKLKNHEYAMRSVKDGH